MKENIQKVIRGIERRISEALGIDGAFVKFGGDHPTREASQFEMEVTMQMVQNGDTRAESVNDGLIREYLNNAGIAGRLSRSNSVDIETGETLLVYKINLSTPERASNLGGYIAAKFDDVVTFRDSAVEQLAQNTKALLAAIERDYKVENQWIYAGAAVFKEGTQPDPQAHELPKNVVTEDQFIAARREAAENAARQEAAARRYESHYAGSDDLFPEERETPRRSAVRETVNKGLLEVVLKQRTGAEPAASVNAAEKAVGGDRQQ